MCLRSPWFLMLALGQNTNFTPCPLASLNSKASESGWPTVTHFEGTSSITRGCTLFVSSFAFKQVSPCLSPFLGSLISIFARRASAYSVYLNIRSYQALSSCSSITNASFPESPLSYSPLSVCLSTCLFFQAVGVLSHQQLLCGFRMSKAKERNF